MKEITRIHIAKVAYDIELNAKKELENYITALERYAGDKELLDDIEIRITELLGERGVQAEGVISSDDVAAVRAQLGEPSDFASEDEEAAPELTSDPRRVYRDTENAILGGVLAGFAQYFKVDPLWVRIIFLISIFFFGAGILIYLILWLIIPPARTSAEKLHMSGKPVTLASIKELSEVEERQSETARRFQRGLGIGTGIVLFFAGIGFLIFTLTVAAGVLFGIGSFPMESFLQPGIDAQWWVVVALGLFILAGLLLSALCFILATVLFRQVWPKRIGMVIGAVIALGLLAFAGGVGAVGYGQFAMQVQADESRRTTNAQLPAHFANVTDLKVAADDSERGIGATDITITYIVSPRSYYEFKAPDDMKPEFTVDSNSTLATVKVRHVGEKVQQWGYRGSTELRIYGPVLSRIETDVNSPSVRYIASPSQPSLAATVKGFGLNLEGTYAAVSVATEEGGSITMNQATVNSLSINGKEGRVEAGTVRSLTVTVPDACPATSVDGGKNASIRVQAVSSTVMTYNGAEQPAKSVSGNCGEVIIGDSKIGEGI